MHQVTIQNALKFLRHELQPDGSFRAWTGTNATDFKPLKSLPSVFPSALIARSLAHVPETQHITRPLVDFLLHNRSEQWSWNYWTKDAVRTVTYPDDLDDTATALTAINLVTPDSIDGHVLGCIARTLTSCETQAGGPYRTWLGTALGRRWLDVDPVVNAAIGQFLSLQGVQLRNLQDYFAECLKRDQCSSPYYLDQLPFIYNLVGWYPDTDSRLQQRATQLLGNVSDFNALQLSMLICICSRLNMQRQDIQPAVDLLLTLRIHNHWPAAALYVDPTENNVQHYAGSSALTTSFAVEALHAVDTLISPPMPVQQKSQTLPFGQHILFRHHYRNPYAPSTRTVCNAWPLPTVTNKFPFLPTIWPSRSVLILPRLRADFSISHP